MRVPGLVLMTGMPLKPNLHHKYKPLIKQFPTPLHPCIKTPCFFLFIILCISSISRGFLSFFERIPNLIPDLTPDMITDLIPDLITDLTPDLIPDLTPDLIHDLTPDLTPDLIHDLIPDLIHDLIPDMTNCFHVPVPRPD